MLYSFTPDITGNYYDFFAHLTLVALFLLLCYEGHRRKFPAAAWLLSLAIIVTFSVLGSRIAVFDLTAWQVWWQGGIFPIATERTSIGVVLFLFPAIWLIRKGLRFNAPILDTLAFALPIFVILRRLGCIAAACCYGLPTESDWGVRYLGPSSIRDQHWTEAVLGADQLGTAAVHPVPLYFILGAFLSLFLLRTYQSKFKQAGSLTLFSLALLLGFRFFIEFFREPATNHQLGAFVFGLKQVQWFLIPTVLILVLSIWIRERRLASTFTKEIIASPNLARITTVNILLFLFVYWMQNSFTIAEKIGIHSFLLLSGIALFVQIIKESKSFRQINWQGGLVGLIALFMMSQSYPSNMSELENETKHVFHANYNYAYLGSSTYDCLQIRSGCGGNTCVRADSLRPNGPRYNNFNFGYNARRFSTRTRWLISSGKTVKYYLTYGVDLQPEFFYDKKTGHRAFRGNIMPYIGRGNDRFEYTIGVRLGNIWGINFPEGIEGEKNSVLSSSIRFGSPDHLYIRGSVENSAALGASVTNAEVSVTMNMLDYSNNRWEYMRFGLANIYENAGLVYVQPAFNWKEQFLITPRIGLSYRREKLNERKQAFKGLLFGLGVEYRMD